MNTTYNTIRDNLKSVFASITAANGYTNTLDPTKFLNVYQPNAQKVEPFNKYPKFFFLLDEGRPVSQVGGRIRKQVYYTVICVVKSDGTVNAVEPQDQLGSILNDVELALVKNYTLLGSAISTQLTKFKMDGGVTYPEGNLIIEVLVTFDSQY